MIVDCFTFNNEFDLLDIRLHELQGVVDYFILSESSVTFSGLEKPLWFNINVEKFRSWHNLSGVEVIDPPKTSNPWEREAYQRNSLLRGLHTFPDDTIVLLGDVDEIPKNYSIPRQILPGQVYVFEQELYYYTMTQRAKGRWRGTRACLLRDLRSWTPQVVRFAGGTPVYDGGWHFSYMGGVDAIQNKLMSFSHQEYNKTEYTSAAAITRRVESNLDLFDREIVQLYTVPGLDHLPEYVKENVSRFAPLIWST